MRGSRERPGKDRKAEMKRGKDTQSNGDRELPPAVLGQMESLSLAPETARQVDAHLPAMLPRMRLAVAEWEPRTCSMEPSVSVYFSSVCWISRRQQHRLSYSVILG